MKLTPPHPPTHSLPFFPLSMLCLAKRRAGWKELGRSGGVGTKDCWLGRRQLWNQPEINGASQDRPHCGVRMHRDSLLQTELMPIQVLAKQRSGIPEVGWGRCLLHDGSVDVHSYK